MGEIEKTFITIDQPIDLGRTMESGQVFRWGLVNDCYYVVIKGHLLSIKRLNSTLELCSSTLSKFLMQKLVSDYFRLDDDLEDIYLYIDTDERIHSAIEEYRGLRIIRQDPWECLVSFICSANSNIPRISTNMNSLAKTYGDRLLLNGFEGYSFPSPTTLAEISESQLRDLKLGFRAKYVSQAAKIIASENLSLEHLRELGYNEAKELLTSIPGVGEKVADCVLLFSLEKLEACPVDRWVRRAMEDWYINKTDMSYQEIRLWAFNKWGPFTGYAQQYLFQKKRLENRVLKL